MKKHLVVFRVSDDEQRKLDALTEATGQNTSAVMRTLLAQADVEPVRSFRLVSNKNSSVPTFQGKHAAIGA